MRWTPVALLVACNADITLDGTAVGNADASVAVTTPEGEGIEAYAARVALTTFSAVDCDGGARLLASGLELPLDGSASLGIPAGTWCGFELDVAGTATWEGTSTAGHAFAIALDLGTISAISDTSFEVVSDGTVAWQLGGRPWLDAGALGADRADVTIAADAPRAADLVAEIADYSVLFDDLDGDGLLDADEGAWVGDDGSHPPPRDGPGGPPRR